KTSRAQSSLGSWPISSCWDVTCLRKTPTTSSTFLLSEPWWVDGGRGRVDMERRASPPGWTSDALPSMVRAGADKETRRATSLRVFDLVSIFLVLSKYG